MAFASLLALTLLSCAAAPNVDDQIAAASAEEPRIVTDDGPLTPEESKQVLEEITTDACEAGMLARHAAIEEAVAETPLVAGNRTRVLHDGPETFRTIFELIRDARDHVNIEFYIMEEVESEGVRLSDLLIEKQREGVAINVIYDSHGSQATPKKFFDRLRDAGIPVIEYNPLDPIKAEAGYDPNARTHRKIVVADGKVAVTGGINLSHTYMSLGSGSASSGSSSGEASATSGDDGAATANTGKDGNEPESPPPEPVAGSSAGPGSAAAATTPDGKPTQWRDTSILIEGPVVAQFQKLFVEHWHEQKGAAIDERNFFPEFQPVGDEVVRIIGSTPKSPVPRYYAAVLSAIRNAETRVWLTASYFIPTDQELADLKAAATRGVDVRLLLPGVSDIDIAVDIARSHYIDLMEAGVKIWEAHGVILHSKTAVIDGVWSVIGSSNFDHRSVLFNDEVDAVVLGSQTGRELQRVFEADTAEARAIELEEWRDRPLLQRAREHLSRVWQRWL